MKILGGKFKGRNYYMPKGVRPTQDVTRKAVFDILGQDLEGVRFLDLFAGSGSVGLEALSRSALFVTFVEKNVRCVRVIEENLQILGIPLMQKALIAGTDAFATIKNLHRQKKKFDIVYLDPPYGRDLAKKALKTLGAYDILHPNCYIVAEHNKREILPEFEGRFILFKHKKYGKSHLSFYQA